MHFLEKISRLPEAVQLFQLPFDKTYVYICHPQFQVMEEIAPHLSFLLGEGDVQALASTGKSC